LSLILDLIDNIGKKKVFTEMDLRWKYNNMRIKEEEKLRDIIKIRDLAVFIDDVMVRMEIEEEYNNIIKE